MKYAEHKIFCNCSELYKICEGNDFDKLYKTSSKLKNRKSKTNNIVMKKYNYMNKYLCFEQKFFIPSTTKGIYKIGHDSIWLLNWLAHYDGSSNVNINCYDLIWSF